MKKIEVFCEGSVGLGFDLGEFSKLDDEAKKKLVTLMARISEKSYRRGFQHGKLENKSVDPVVFRFKTPIDHSPYTDTFYKDGKWASKSGHSAVSRLFMEYGVLTQIGFADASID